MALLVRTWNVFHGNAHPPQRRSFLRHMLELVVADGPDVVCLQELPVWALRRLERWTAMQVATSVARRPLLLPGGIAGWVTRRHQGLLRSGLTGQANAILVAAGHARVDLGGVRISEGARERRTCHAVRIDGRIVVANLHASNAVASPGVMHAELERALAYVDSLGFPDDAIVLAGDFNLRGVRLRGFSEPASGVDHVLVRGATSSVPHVWPVERRAYEGTVLSDHAPVEVTVE